MMKLGATAHAPGSRDVLEQLLEVDAQAKRQEDEAKQNAQQRVEAAHEEAKKLVEKTRGEAEQEAERFVEEAEQKRKGQDKSMREIPFGSLEGFSEHVEENMSDAVEYVMRWVTHLPH